MIKRDFSYTSILFLVTTLFAINACDNNNNYNYRCNKKVETKIVNTQKKHYKKTYSSKDSITKNRIIGKWKKILKHKDGSIIYVTTHFYHNGRFYTDATKKLRNGKRVKLYSKGTWRVKNGYLIEKTHSSNYANRNRLTKDKIILTTNSQLVYKTTSGKVFTYNKVR